MPPVDDPGSSPRGGQDQEGPSDPSGDTNAEGDDTRSTRDGGTQDGPKNRQGARKDSGPADEASPQWGNVFQHFHGNVYADHGQFGRGSTAAAEPRSARVQGLIEEAEIGRIVLAYAQPDGYAEAAEALDDERVILLAGEAGSGRWAGAISLLARARKPDKPLVGFSPAITVEELAARSFDEGAGYIVSDMFDGQLAPELADFHWRDVCRKVRKSKAYLVVTIGAESRAARSDVVRKFRWQRPGAADALRAQLGAANVSDELIGKVAEAIGPGFQLSDIPVIARRIAAAENIEEVLNGLQETDRLIVASWLDEVDAEIPAVLEVAALAFLLGVAERVFEAELSELKARIAEFAPTTNITSKKAKAEVDLRFSQLRKRRSGHRLLTVCQVPVSWGSGSLSIRHVDFRVQDYRQHVVAELWDRLPNDFWAGMRRWLQDIVTDDRSDPNSHADLLNSASIGLALLALVAPDEVLDSYLGPWTAEEASLNEQIMAVYLVWRMSMLEQLAPLALQSTILWAGQGSRTERRLATYAFSGPLGARYPLEAVKRLSQLADQGEVLAARAHAQLFATLARQDSDAVVVLGELRQRMNDPKDRPSGDLVLDTIVELLTIRDPLSGRPAVALFLVGNPSLAGQVAPLWARVLYMRPWRDRAIAAILSTLGTIEHHYADPEDLAYSLGSAIGSELPSHERAILRSEVLMRYDHARDSSRGKRHRAGGSSARPQVSRLLLEAFLDACANPLPSERG